MFVLGRLFTLLLFPKLFIKNVLIENLGAFVYASFIRRYLNFKTFSIRCQCLFQRSSRASAKLFGFFVYVLNRQ